MQRPSKKSGVERLNFGEILAVEITPRITQTNGTNSAKSSEMESNYSLKGALKMGRKKLYRNESKFSLDGNDKRTQKWRDVFTQNKMSD